MQGKQCSNAAAAIASSRDGGAPSDGRIESNVSVGKRKCRNQTHQFWRDSSRTAYVGRHCLKTFCNLRAEQLITSVIKLAHQAHTRKTRRKQLHRSLAKESASSGRAKQFHIAYLWYCWYRLERRTFCKSWT